jgi:hypothetical protein
MTNRYNSYAAKIYAEHPIALWALDENTSSLTTETVSNIGDLGEIDVARAIGHSLSMPNGYYVNPLQLSRNDSVPLVFGAYNSTTIYGDGSVPAIVIPAQGFLVERGRYFGLTVEFWINISNGTTSPKRIFGPIGSEDGLYVDGPFIGLKINKNYSSHYVGAWGRPMLVQFSVTQNLTTLTINGASVISMNIQTESIDLSPETTEEGNSLDWLGFYATEETSPIMVDCIAMYAYRVTEDLAKQRFVYGQGTQSVDTIFNTYTTTPISIDYSFSKFGKNRTYPDLFRWENGYMENLEVNNGKLSVPEYSLPLISISGKTVDEWKGLQYGADRQYFKLNDGTDYSGYLAFNSLNVTIDSFRGFYGVFEIPATMSTTQTLFKIENQQTKKNFEILLSQTENTKKIEYRLNSTLLYSENIASEDSKFVVGLDLSNSLKSDDFKDVYDIFTDKLNSKIFVGGYQSEESERVGFSGKIFRIGFYTDNNYQKIKAVAGANSISEDGYFDKDVWSDLEDYISSYTLVPKNNLGFFDLDIAVSGYWENNVSLSSLSKTTAEGIRGLDYFQFNIDYPESETLATNLLSKNSSSEILRSYLIFKEPSDISELNSWGNESQIVAAPATNVVKPVSNQIGKKLKVYNDTVIYVPEVEDALDYSAIIRLEFDVDGIFSKPIRVRSMEIASRSLEETGRNAIGTKFGKELFPYVGSESSKNYKSFNPLIISKSRSNYLYLTKNTGIGLVGENFENRRISFEVNERNSSFYQIGMAQFVMNYSKPYFEISKDLEEDVLVFEIIGSGESNYRIYIDFSSENQSNIGKLYSKKVVGGVESITEEIKIYLNGVEKSSPVIKPGEWYFVGIEFSKPVIFDSFSGNASLCGPAKFDNVSLSLISESELSEKTVFRFWSAIDGTEATPNYWEDWYVEDDVPSNDILWEDFVTTSAIFEPVVRPSLVYNSYIGSNSIIADSYSIDSTTSNILFTFGGYQYRAKTDMLFAEKVSTPL